jgi:hypothetical protein
MIRWKIRSRDFVGQTEYTQGVGMTYDDVVVECDDGEEVFAVDRTWISGKGFESRIPVLRVWSRRMV